MSIKETGLAFCASIENEVIQIRADQHELAQELTERINGVANRLKALDAKFDKRFDELETKFDKRFNVLENRFDGLENRFDGLEKSHEATQATVTKIMDIVVSIQRKLDAA